jgi:glycogen operon protein
MAVFLNGGAIPEPDTRGQAIVDDHFMVLFNGSPEAMEFVLPDADYGDAWTAEVNTAEDSVVDTATPEVVATAFKPGQSVTAEGRSIVVLRCPRQVSVGTPGGAASARR